MKKNIFLTIIFLTFLSLLSFFINVRRTPLSNCLTTDEAAFGYNAYSLLKTGRDEYGTLLSLRLKSFGDYKMPLYSYLSIPFIAADGLNETSARALNTFLAILFPFVIYLLAEKLFRNKITALISALFVTLSPGIQMVGKQAHEAYLAVFLLCLISYFFVRFKEKNSLKNFIVFLCGLGIFSFAYQSSRLWIGLFVLGFVVYAVNKVIDKKYLLFLLIAVFILVIPDLIVKPARVNNLLFFNNIGLGLKTAELRSEGGSRFIYNKATVGLKDFLFTHLSYLSPQFLVITGDENKRFGYEGISPMTLIEYLGLFIGLYYLFKNKSKNRCLLLTILLLAPLSGSLSWAGFSLTRTLPLIVTVLIISAYGYGELIKTYKSSRLFIPCLLLTVVLYGGFVYYSWDFFFNHYSKRAQAIRSFQCGNKEMAQYVKKNYSSTDVFYITNKNSEPYIFLLFYMNYDPAKYQRQALLSAPDEFGFGQINYFDKFYLQFNYDPKMKNTTLIGFPDDFKDIKLDNSRLQKIKVGTEEIFWIYKN